jgi:arylsulfatase/uncharacterized sulfatase
VAVERPNFVVIVLDDVALTDLAPYGGEAHTPNIQALAARGALLTQYRSSPLCSPSRAMLLTGVNNHRAGVGTIPETLPPAHESNPQYQGRIAPGVQTLATRLRAEGYRSYLTGKWHLGHGHGALPIAHGFDRSYTLDASGADNWEQKPYMPYYQRADWFEGAARATLPEDFYSSRFLVAQMIRYLEADRSRDQPFFAYIGFLANHIPLQAPTELVEKYRDTYQAGWDALRLRRWQQAQKLGLIAPASAPPEVHPNLRAWQQVPAEERALLTKGMAVHAAMLDAVDQELGKLITYLKQRGDYERTVFVLTSDNGPEPSDPLAARGYGLWMRQHGYTRALENLGGRRSIAYIGPEWANATASPSRLFKFHTSEGGLRVPMIIAGPGIVAGQKLDASAFVTDVTPTLLDLAKATALPEKTLDGISLRPALAGAPSAGERSIALEVAGNVAYYQGPYKLLKITRPWDDARWRLYDIRRDPSEAHDLSQQEPERLQTMIAAYQNYAAANGVLALPADFDPHRQTASNARRAYVLRQLPTILAIATALAGLVWWWQRRRRAQRG